MKLPRIQIDRQLCILFASAFALLAGLIWSFGVDLGILFSAVFWGLVCLIVKPRFAIGSLALHLVLFVGIYFLTMVDVRMHGPYVTWFNEQMLQRATDANLVGSKLSEVEMVLGPAANKWIDENSNRATFNYPPYRHFPFAKFQVHCRNGKVESLELFDD